ncbi:hypothetical protein [Horticoccus sp. 23ND18S-11]|uniref:hypothetical protein n=1 Tax=Horticoccus sp. 23ND18S-11 TaxID=3391832 RepID=UPI0039C991EE
MKRTSFGIFLMIGFSKAVAGLSPETAKALTEMLTSNPAFTRAIGGSGTYFIRDVSFSDDEIAFISYEIVVSLGGTSCERTWWHIPISGLREANVEVKGVSTPRERYGELRVTSPKEDAFRHVSELSSASIPIGVGPHLKCSTKTGSASQFKIMFYSEARAEEFRDALMKALMESNRPNKAPEPTPVSVTPRATEGKSK